MKPAAADTLDKMDKRNRARDAKRLHVGDAPILLLALGCFGRRLRAEAIVTEPPASNTYASIL